MLLKSFKVTCTYIDSIFLKFLKDFSLFSKVIDLSLAVEKTLIAFYSDCPVMLKS